MSAAIHGATVAISSTPAAVSSRDLERRQDDDPLLRIPRFQIGKVGIESKLENGLRGRAGARQVEVNAVGRVMRELDRREGTAGQKLQLTVDANLQSYIKARLGEESASVVVMDCKTGALRAIASAPSYDPNKFVRGISYNDYNELRDNDHRPLASKTVQDAYPPGSTFKMVTVLAALENGTITPEDTFFCTGHLDVSNRRFHCWKGGGHGKVDLVTSMKESCDVYYYELALQVGIERIADMARRLGLGEKHAVPMSGQFRTNPGQRLEACKSRGELADWGYGGCSDWSGLCVRLSASTGCDDRAFGQWSGTGPAINSRRKWANQAPNGFSRAGHRSKAFENRARCNVLGYE